MKNASGGVQLLQFDRGNPQGDITKQVIQVQSSNGKSVANSNLLNTIGLKSGSRTIENMVSSSELTSLHISAQPRLCGPHQATLSLVLQSKPQETLLDGSPKSPVKQDDCILAPTMDSFKLKKGQVNTFTSMLPIDLRTEQSKPTTAMVKTSLE